MNDFQDKYLIVISLDALKADDLDIIKNLPNFSKLINHGSIIKRVKTIYPSLTYPAHTTIVTGKYPKNHNIINNKPFNIKHKNTPWYWYRKYITSSTIYDEAKKNNLTVSSIFWPVSALSSIKYNMPEIFTYNKHISQETISLLSGSFLYQLKMFYKYKKMKDGFKEPELDDFGISVACETIKLYKPNLLMIHLLDLDSNRHVHGTNSVNAINALKRHDERIGLIIKTLKDNNLYSKSNIVILGDHGFQDYQKVISLNTLFKKEGYIKTNEKHNILDWSAIAKSCDGSAYIYLKNENDLTLKSNLYNLLCNLAKLHIHGIEKIFNKDELINLGGDSNASFMIEACKGFAFTDNICSSIESIPKPNGNESFGTHGYSPMKSSLDTLFIGFGPRFKSNTTIDKGNLIDIAPTLAQILNIPFPPCDGKSIDKIIK